MAELWFSSDHHFHHFNILKYAERPFTDIREMHECLIDRHNELVKPEDHWTCLGDVTMQRDSKGYGLNILRRLNGHKRLILGNHDHYAMKFYLEHFEKVMAMNVIGGRGTGLRFTHIPVHPNSMGGVMANIHGHTHQHENYPPVIWKNPETGRVRVQPYLNISVERTDYRPVTLDWIVAEVERLREEGG